MKDWTEILEKYLTISDYDIISGTGKVSHEEAEVKALAEYEKFRRTQDKTIMSDFDKFIEGLE